MINYKLEEEEKFAKYYAVKLEDSITVSILDSGEVRNSNEARHLSVFFWNMVEAAIEDEKQKLSASWTQSGQFLTEKLLQSISGYLSAAGYEKEWDEVSDEKNP